VSVNSKIFLHICDDCRIFREGEWEKNIGSSGLFGCLVSPNFAVECNELIKPNDVGPLQLIVICVRTKIFLILRDDRTIFCEGEWSPTTTKMHDDFTYFSNQIGLVGFIYGFVGLGVVSLIVFGGIIGVSLRNQALGRNLAFGRKLAFGRNQAFGRILASSHKLAFGRNQAFGRILAFGCNQAFGRNQAYGHNQALGRNLAFGRKLAFGRNQAFGRILASSRNRYGIV
jgi:hypothetical protein